MQSGVRQAFLPRWQGCSEGALVTASRQPSSAPLKMAPHNPPLLVLAPLLVLPTEQGRPLSSRTLQNRHDWLLRPGHSWTILSGGSQLPCREDAQAALWRGPWSEDRRPLPTASANVPFAGVSTLKAEPRLHGAFR